MTLRLFHDPGFAAPIGDHIMPMRKFALVAEELRNQPGIQIDAPHPVSRADLRRVHTEEYIGAIERGLPRELAESQKFPWSPALLPSVCLTNGGVLDAARAALDERASGALASGFHHAFADHGEGFCTFNGLIVALEALRAEGRIKTAAIIDLDLHYGNGTAALAATRPWIRALSIYGSDYWENTAYRDVTVHRHQDGKNHRSAAMAPSRNDARQLRELLAQHLPWLTSGFRPDLLLFQAGADPLRSDPYSPLDLGADDLRDRDRSVFEFARAKEIPIAWVLAGGYSRDLRLVVQVHVNTALVCRDVFASR